MSTKRKYVYKFSEILSDDMDYLDSDYAAEHGVNYRREGEKFVTVLPFLFLEYVFNSPADLLKFYRHLIDAAQQEKEFADILRRRLKGGYDHPLSAQEIGTSEVLTHYEHLRIERTPDVMEWAGLLASTINALRSDPRAFFERQEEEDTGPGFYLVYRQDGFYVFDYYPIRDRIEFETYDELMKYLYEHAQVLQDDFHFMMKLQGAYESVRAQCPHCLEERQRCNTAH